MIHTKTPLPGTAGSERIALFTDHAVMALDIVGALESIGCDIWVGHSYNVADLQSAAEVKFRAAIVDLDPPNAEHAEAALAWLAACQTPTVVISDNDDPHDSQRDLLARYNNVVARFTKPFKVDAILPVMAPHARPADV